MGLLGTSNIRGGVSPSWAETMLLEALNQGHGSLDYKKVGLVTVTAVAESALYVFLTIGAYVVYRGANETSLKYSTYLKSSSLPIRWALTTSIYQKQVSLSTSHPKENCLDRLDFEQEMIEEIHELLLQDKEALAACRRQESQAIAWLTLRIQGGWKSSYEEFKKTSLKEVSSMTGLGKCIACAIEKIPLEESASEIVYSYRPKIPGYWAIGVGDRCAWLLTEEDEEISISYEKFSNPVNPREASQSIFKRFKSGHENFNYVVTRDGFLQIWPQMRTGFYQSVKPTRAITVG